MGNTWEVIEKQGRSERCGIPQNDSLTNRKLQSLDSFLLSCARESAWKAPIIKWQSCSRYFVASAARASEKCHRIAVNRLWKHTISIAHGFRAGCVMENTINKAIMQRNHSREWSERLNRATEMNSFAAQLPHLAWYQMIMEMCKMLLNKVWITREHRYATKSATIKIAFPCSQRTDDKTFKLKASRHTLEREEEIGRLKCRFGWGQCVDYNASVVWKCYIHDFSNLMRKKTHGATY